MVKIEITLKYAGNTKHSRFNKRLDIPCSERMTS